MKRIVPWAILASILVLQLTGCRHGALSRRVVDRGLAGGAGSDLDRERVMAEGESAIPVIFDALRRNPGDNQIYFATSMLWEMTRRGLVDPKAPYVRSVLADTGEQEDIRIAAVEMLAWYGDASEIERALMAGARREKSVRVRAACIAALSSRVTVRAVHAGRCTVAPSLEALLSQAIADKNPMVRKQACSSVGGVAVSAASCGVRLDWCRPLLVRARRDSDYGVRKAAVDMLLMLDQEERKRARLTAETARRP